MSALITAVYDPTKPFVRYRGDTFWFYLPLTHVDALGNPTGNLTAQEAADFATRWPTRRMQLRLKPERNKPQPDAALTLNTSDISIVSDTGTSGLPPGIYGTRPPSDTLTLLGTYLADLELSSPTFTNTFATMTYEYRADQTQ